MMLALPLMALVVVFCLAIRLCHQQAQRIVTLETTLQLQLYAQHLAGLADVRPDRLREARLAADDAAQAVLAGQQVL